MTRKLALAASFLAIAATPACGAQDAANAQDREAIEQIVREYILENPEIIEEALIELSSRQQARSDEEARAAVTDNQDALYANAADYSVGPEDAPVTVVEFFDYRCGFCKKSAGWTTELPEKFDGQVRVVFKEYPILSPESEKAAYAAIAAGEQGKYLEMHLELMELENNSGFDADDINDAAERAGVDVEKMRADMDSMQVRQQVAASKELGRTLSIGGTPAFYVGENMVPGADQAAVEALIESALENQG